MKQMAVTFQGRKISSAGGGVTRDNSKGFSQPNDEHGLENLLISSQLPLAANKCEGPHATSLQPMLLLMEDCPY